MSIIVGVIAALVGLMALLATLNGWLSWRQRGGDIATLLRVQYALIWWCLVAVLVNGALILRRLAI